jgi:hypothetical protein
MWSVLFHPSPAPPHEDGCTDATFSLVLQSCWESARTAELLQAEYSSYSFP